MRFDPIGWAKAHKPQAALGVGAVGAVGVGLYRRRATAGGAQTTASGVPVGATTAASTQPYGDTAGGIPFDPSAFNFDPGNYLGQISQEIGTTNTRLGQIEKNTKRPAPKKKKPVTGGHAHKKPPAPKPKRKTPRKKRHP